MTEHLPECPVWRCCKPDERATMHMCICPDDERIGGLITRQRAEQIGRNIGQYGCVIPEQQHLPECLALLNDSTWDGDCICDALRACERRVAEETAVAMMESFYWKPSPPHDKHYFADNVCAYCIGRREALDAAVQQVAALPEYKLRDTCVAAINELRQERP